MSLLSGSNRPKKLKALWSFKTSGSTYPTTEHNIPEDLNHQVYVCMYTVFQCVNVSTCSSKREDSKKKKKLLYYLHVGKFPFVSDPDFRTAVLQDLTMGK